MEQNSRTGTDSKTDFIKGTVLKSGFPFTEINGYFLKTAIIENSSAVKYANATSSIEIHTFQHQGLGVGTGIHRMLANSFPPTGILFMLFMPNYEIRTMCSIKYTSVSL